MLQNLSELACNIMVEQYLSDLEVKTLRLVSKGLKSWIDSNLTALKPRASSRSQVISSESLLTRMSCLTHNQLLPVIHGFDAFSWANLGQKPMYKRLS